MMIKFIFYFFAFIFPFSIFAEVEKFPELFDLQTSQERVLDKRENYFLTATDNKITPKVNPITGEYCEEEVDLVVAGAEPLSVSRFYNHLAPYDPRHASWRYNPESFFVGNLEWEGQEIFMAIGEADGSICSFKRSTGDSYIFDFEVSKSFSAFQPEGQSHPLNTKINYWRFGDPKDKRRFQYMGTITDGSGRERSFASPMHRWKDYVYWKDRIKTGLLTSAEITWSIHPIAWTPYRIPIVEERLPNGNILCYTYTQWKKEKKGYPLPSLLGSITAYNADKSKILGSIQFHYPRAKHKEVAGVQVTGSDGRVAFMQHAGKQPIVLASAKRPGQPSIAYDFQEGTLNRIEKPEGRVLTTEYLPETNKVSAQYAPVGPNGEMCPISRYEYQDNATIVFDAEDHKTVYRYDENKKITSIEVHQDNTLYRADRFTWDPTTGNLKSKTVEDNNGTLLQIIEYQYDKNQNPIEEKIGDGQYWRTLTRTFSDDGFNLKLSESDREGKRVRYNYVPHTNLLASEFFYEDDAIRTRTFNFYDECAICIKTITDDGSSEDPYDMQGVTLRRITETTPKQTTPCFGLPENVVEKSIDSSGKEILLGRVTYTYTSFGKVLQEDHYDSEDTYRFSLINTYDDQECLISKTDPLGAKTTFTYDANYNILSISGPNQYQEITYDQVNRPIRIADRQTDGTFLFIEKRYDKLGRIIEEIDTCKNSTYFDYDALGRVTAIHHPDGAIERKEYDVLGNIIKEIDPEGYETTKIHDLFGQVTSAHYPDGSEEHSTYHPTGTLQSQIDKNGSTTLYTYDIFDHLIQTETYSSSGHLLKSTSSSWSPFQKLSEIEGDLITIYTYDFAGQKTDEQKAQHKTQYAYDSLGRLAYTQNEETRYVKEHDLCDRLIQARTEKETILQKQERYAYDSDGNCTHIITSQGSTETLFNTDGTPLSIKDPLGHTHTFAYSHQEVLTKTSTNPKGIQTLITCDTRGRETLSLKKNTRGEIIQSAESLYDKNGNPVQLTHTLFSDTTPIKTITHNWEYGPLGRLERFIEAEEKETRYLYDSRGRLQTIIKPNGCKVMHEYDDLGRLARYQSIDFDYHYTYDARDRVTAVFDAISKTHTLRSYDPLGNILQETLSNGLTLSNTYDTRGRRIVCELPDASKITYTYDGIYLHTVTRNSHIHTYSERNLEGEITHIVQPSGKIHIERDALGRYTSLTSPHFTASYPKYDPTGNLLYYNYQDHLGNVDCHYTYDDLDQLTQENEHAYHLDSLHNRLKKDANNYAVNSLCQVTHDGQSAYTYDLCGNLISDGTRRYTYDNLDRLIAIEEDAQQTEYTYDPFHRRLSKTVYLKGFKIKQVRFLWDGNNEIGTVDEQDDIQELRILGEGLGAEIGSAVLYELETKPYIPIHDHRGCVVTLIDLSTNTPLETYRYTAFGEELTEGNFSPWRFSSKRVDEETGLVFFGRRYYHPELGRWITQDPQGFEDGPNLYAYIHHSPLTQIDLYGLLGFGQCCGAVSRTAFRGIEWTGANLIPIPYVQGFVESVGRWGAGGEFRGASRYRTNKHEVIRIPGTTTPGQSYTHGNGMMTKRSDAIKQAEHVSQTHGGVQVDLLYQGTNGLIMDLIGCGFSKLGIPSSYNTMCASYYAREIRDDPTHRFTSSVHSRGGIQMMNTGRLLSPGSRKHIDVLSYGSATLIPSDYFKSAENNLSPFDLVAMTNPIAYILGLMSKQYDVNFLTPATRCPLKAHGFLEDTYSKEIARRGYEFKKKYFNK